MDNKRARETIHIAYIPEGSLSLVSMYSVLKNTPEADINFIILHSDLTKQELKDIEKLKTIRSFTAQYFKIDENDFKDFPLATWVGIQTWFRFQIPELCPNIDKVIYLDADTLVRKSLYPLWKIDISDKIIAGVEDSRNVKQHIARLGMKDSSYFNAGVLIMNLQKLRKIAPFVQIKQFVMKNRELLKYNDQDLLNLLGDSNKINLPIKYNYMEPWWMNVSVEYEGEQKLEYEQAKKDASIVHFVGPKPDSIGCKNSYIKEWWKYAKRLPIYQRELKKIKKLSTPKITQTKSVNLFFICPLISMITRNNTTTYNLLGVIPFLQVKNKSRKTKISLFKYIPLIKVTKKGK